MDQAPSHHKFVPFEYLYSLAVQKEVIEPFNKKKKKKGSIEGNFIENYTIFLGVT